MLLNALHLDFNNTKIVIFYSKLTEPLGDTILTSIR